MNIDQIPTPEMDGFEINSPDTRANAIMALNAVIVKGKDLERRLTIARETLIMIADESANLEHAERMADLDRLVKILNEAYVFLGMPHKALHPWRIALDEWQAKVEKETGWNHFDEVNKFEQNVDVGAPAP